MTATWTTASLTAARERGDPLAQHAVSAAFGMKDDIDLGTAKISEFMQLLVAHDGLPYATLPEPVQDFLVQSSTIPSWYDGEKLKKGEALFMEHGLLSLAALLHASLPECYLMERGVHVLWMTQQLDEHVFRRLLETAQMVVTVMTPGGIRAENGRLVGPGIEVAQKVRLMHETMRHLILEARPGTPSAPALRLSDVMTRCTWARKQWGAPINQEDMAYTLLTFGYIIPRSLVRFGVSLAPDEQEAIIHAWNVVGHVMGVDESLMAHSLADCERLYGVIQQQQAAGSVMAQEMTKSLIRVVRQQLPSFFGWAPPVLIELLCGRKVAKMLGLRPEGAMEYLVHVPVLYLLRVLLVLERVLFSSSRVGRALLLTLGEHLVQMLSSFPKGTRDRSFELPREVARAWGLVPS